MTPEGIGYGKYMKPKVKPAKKKLRRKKKAEKY